MEQAQAPMSMKRHAAPMTISVLSGNYVIPTNMHGKRHRQHMTSCSVAFNIHIYSPQW